MVFSPVARYQHGAVLESPSKLVEGDTDDLEGRRSCLLSQKLGVAFSQPHSPTGTAARSMHAASPASRSASSAAPMTPETGSAAWLTGAGPRTGP